MRRFALAAVAAVVLVAGHATGAAAEPKVDIAGGYSFLHSEPAGVNFGFGWFGTVGFSNLIPQLPTVDIVGDIAGGYRSEGGVDGSGHAFMVGPRMWWRQPMSPISVYGQLLIGLERASASAGTLSVTDTGFSVAPGGGIDYKLNEQWGARAGLNFRFANHNPWSKDIQIILGAVYHLK